MGGLAGRRRRVAVAAGWCVRGIPRRADAGRGVGRARRRRRGVHGVGGGDALRAGAAPAGRREQPPGRGEPGDDAHAGGAGRRRVGRRSRGARPGGGDAGEPGVLRGGLEHRPGRAAAVRRRARRWSTPSGGGPGERRSALVLPAVAMGLALLALGLLVARVVGPWAGVATAAGTGILFPVLHTARATYSEPLAMLTLTGGLLAADARRGRGRDAAGPARWPAPDRHPRGRGGRVRRRRLVAGDGASVGRRCARSCVATRRRGPGCSAGLLVGGTGLVRVDALREVVLLLPVLAAGGGVRGALGAAGARRAGRVAAGVGGRGGGAVVAVPRVDRRQPGAAARARRARRGWLVGGARCCGGAAGGCRRPCVRRLPDVAAAGLVVLAGLYLASRPLWQVVRQDPDDPGSRYVAGMQARQGLPVDGGRTYAEQTVGWLSWYVGPVALVVALVVLALRRAARRALGDARAPVEAWLPALVVAAGSTAAHPAAAGHHARPPVGRPAAARRAAARRGARRRRARLGACGGRWPPGRAWGRGHGGRAWSAALVVVPAVVATWPHRAGGVERGSLAAVDRVCGALGPATSCWPSTPGRPTSGRRWCAGCAGCRRCRRRPGCGPTRRRLAATVATVGERASRHAGGRLVLLAADSPEALDAARRRAGVGRRRRRCARTSTCSSGGPSRTDPLPVRVWLAPVAAGLRLEVPASPVLRARPRGRSRAATGRPSAGQPLTVVRHAGSIIACSRVADLLAAEAQEAAVLGGIGRLPVRA